MEELAKSASNLWPHINKADQIRNFSGILPKWVDENGVIQDFKIEIKEDIAPHAVNLVGIESPGLTAAVPIAQYVVELMKEHERLVKNDQLFRNTSRSEDLQRHRLRKKCTDPGK